MSDLTIRVPVNQIQLLKDNQICLDARQGERSAGPHSHSRWGILDIICPSGETFTYTSIRINDSLAWKYKAPPRSNLPLSKRISLYFNSFFQKTVTIRWGESRAKTDYDPSISITVDDKTFETMKNKISFDRAFRGPSEYLTVVKPIVRSITDLGLSDIPEVKF